MAVSDIQRQRVEETVEVLRGYNLDPFITGFVRAQPQPRIPLRRYDKTELCDVIQEVLLGEFKGRRSYRLKLENLVEHVDGLQETGRQSLYAFHLAEDDRDEVLATLRDPETVKSRLGGPKEIYDGGRIVWEAWKGPELAQVRYEAGEDAEPPDALIIKWVESRSYWAKPQETTREESTEDLEEELEQEEEEEGEEEELASERLSIRVRRDERAVSFLRIDLNSGLCQLRLQALRSRALGKREQQLLTYRNLIAETLGLRLVGPTVLAPAIRCALASRRTPIVHCRAILPEGGVFIGRRGERPPVDVRQLEAGVAIRFEWRPSKGGVSRIELDGRLDEILITKPLIPAEHGRMLEWVWRLREEGLRVFTTPTIAVVDEETTANRDRDGPSAPPDPGLVPEDWAQLLKAALLKEAPRPPAVEPGIDDAVREYERNHKIEDRALESRALEQFLRYIEEVASAERAQYEAELEVVRAEEAWGFRLMIIAALLALGFVTAAGVMLLFFPGNVTIDTITAILGVITGRGTVLIRNYHKELRAKRDGIQVQQRDSVQTLMAIQTALSIPGADLRAEAMSQAVTMLLNRVTESGTGGRPTSAADLAS